MSDLRLILGPDGSRLQFSGGEPLYDRGLENMVLISLFTGPGWCGNSLLSTPIGSDFEIACNQPITRSALNQIRNAAERALSAKVFGRVSVGVRNTVGHRLEVGVLLVGARRATKLTRDGQLWYYQATSPASGGIVTSKISQFWDDGRVWDDSEIWRDRV